VTEVNQLLAHALGYHLEPVGWETSLPGKGVRKRLNRRWLNVKRYGRIIKLSL